MIAHVSFTLAITMGDMHYKLRFLLQSSWVTKPPKTTRNVVSDSNPEKSRVNHTRASENPFLRVKITFVFDKVRV
jgi:hypothetical protein